MCFISLINYVHTWKNNCWVRSCWCPQWSFHHHSSGCLPRQTAKYCALCVFMPTTANLILRRAYGCNARNLSNWDTLGANNWWRTHRARKLAMVFVSSSSVQFPHANIPDRFLSQSSNRRGHCCYSDFHQTTRC
jgi:hypothetical protein